MDRAPGLSVRLKLTLSYAGFLMLAGAVLLVAGYFSLSRGVHPGVIFVVRSHAELLRAFAPTAAIVLAFLLVFGLVGGWLLAGRMLAPLTPITDATRLAATGSLSHRIELDGRQDEFRELADSFDAMLARLEAHVAEQQRFAANASHELRTPLAITQTLLDVARNDPNGDRDTGELVDRLHVVNTRAIDLTEALLLLSRADQRSFAREHVDLSLIAEEASETLLPLAEKRGLTIETSGELTPTIGSHALLLQMTTNLVHNAIVHNLPEQGTVWVTTSVHPTGVVLTVENTGEKLTPQLVATLAEPFLRGTKRIRADHAGVGLGLAIVKSITEAHDGTLTLTAAGRGRAPRHRATTRRADRTPASTGNGSNADVDLAPTRARFFVTRLSSRARCCDQPLWRAGSAGAGRRFRTRFQGHARFGSLSAQPPSTRSMPPTVPTAPGRICVCRRSLVPTSPGSSTPSGRTSANGDPATRSSERRPSARADRAPTPSSIWPTPRQSPASRRISRTSRRPRFRSRAGRRTQ